MPLTTEQVKLQPLVAKMEAELKLLHEKLSKAEAARVPVEEARKAYNDMAERVRLFKSVYGV